MLASEIKHTFLPINLVFFGRWGLHQWHMKVPRLWVESELQVLAYTTVIAMQDLSRIYDLHHKLMVTPDS